MFAVRFDGRGGQGVMTAAELLAAWSWERVRTGTPGFWAGVLAGPELARRPRALRPLRLLARRAPPLVSGA